MALTSGYRVSVEDRAAALARIRAGESRRSIARELGVADGTIRNWEKSAAKAARQGEVVEGVQQGMRAQTLARLKLINAQAEEMGQLIEAASTEAMARLAVSMTERLGAGEADSLTLPQSAVVFGILSDKSVKQRELRSKAEAQGRAAGDLNRLSKDELEQRREQLKQLRRGD